MRQLETTPSRLILPGVSHFAFLQDPRLFDAALREFLAPADADR